MKKDDEASNMLGEPLRILITVYRNIVRLHYRPFPLHGCVRSVRHRLIVSINDDPSHHYPRTPRRLEYAW